MAASALLVSSLLVSCPAPEACKDDGESRSALIERVFNDLGPDTMALLDEFYDAEVVFEDPLGKIEGLDSLRRYYEGLYQNVTEIAFDFDNEVVQGDQHVIQWTMRMKAKKLNKGKEVTLDGTSVIRFGESGKVRYHRDYFDMGEFIYQHVPILRFLVNQVNDRLKHDAE